jgi:hypothetical protein
MKGLRGERKVEYSHGKPFQKRWEHLNSYANMHRQKCTHFTEVSSLLTAEPVLHSVICLTTNQKVFFHI